MGRRLALDNLIHRDMSMPLWALLKPSSTRGREHIETPFAVFRPLGELTEEIAPTTSMALRTEILCLVTVGGDSGKSNELLRKDLRQAYDPMVNSRPLDGIFE